MPHLRYTDAVGAESVVELFDGVEVLVGRVSQCEIVVPQAFVSRRHARISRRDGRWQVEDLQSRHGTFVGNERVTGPRVLADGEVIAVGDALIGFHSGNAPRGASTGGSTGPIPQQPLREATSSGRLIAPVEASIVLAAHAAAEGIVGSLLAKQGAGDAVRPESAALLFALLKVATELRQCATVAEACGVAARHAIASARASRAVVSLKEDGGAFVPKAQLDAEGEAVSFEWCGDLVDRAVREKLALAGRAQGPDGRVHAMLCAPLWEGRAGSERAIGWIYLDVEDKSRAFLAADLDLVSAISFQLAAEVTRLSLGERVRSEEARRASLSRFLSTDVVRLIEQTDSRARSSSHAKSTLMEVREQEVTILFADLQGFTRLAERLGPSQVKSFLDGWLDEVTEVIVDHHGGTLDKYMGDGVMALFGAPFSQGTPADAKSAVRAALAIRDVAEKLRRKQGVYADLHVRIGLNTGKVVAGMMGSQRRAEYSVIGDAVNIASRLENVCDPDRILVGEGTWAAIGDSFELEAVGERNLRGRESAVRCWYVQRSADSGGHHTKG